MSDAGTRTAPRPSLEAPIRAAEVVGALSLATDLGTGQPLEHGKKLDVDCCIVFEVKDGRIVSGTEHFFDLYAWDDFWS